MVTENEVLAAANEVFAIIAGKVSTADLARVKDAFQLAYEAHKGQTRKTGEPYIIHPIAVAKIVAKDLELDANPVIAAFLHDVVEDTDFTLDDVRDRFGDDVAFLVDVVTKKKKDGPNHSKQIDNFRQILDSVHYDIRALLVKMADRLHNMRTLESMRPDKQMKIAGETDFFYAPLANRLGLYHVKSELENLSFKYRCPREYAEIERLLEEDREATAEGVKGFIGEIESILRARGIKFRIEVRYRKPYSIWRNMNETGADFAHVDFKHYVRVIYTPTEPWTEKDTSLFIYSSLTDRFKERPGSVVNYIDNPKENGYQSFHVKLFGRRGSWEEMHISSERMLRNSRLGCIAERKDENVSLWLDRFRQLLQDMARNGSELDFMEGISSSFYFEDILVFTPSGRGVLLPKGATALDFAFEIHTDLGEHAQYARINGKLASVKTELHAGDCVEIGTDPSVNPTVDWLDHVITYKAKRHLRTELKRRSTLPFVRCSYCHPLPGDEVIGFKDEATGRITIHSRHCPEAIKLASENGDAIVAVAFEESPDFLYPVRLSITAVDRYHLLRDIIDCITADQHLSMDRLETRMTDRIVTCVIDFSVHSRRELQSTMDGIMSIKGVDEVQRLEQE